MADGKPINLNKARKARARTAAKARAKENRAKHGQSGEFKLAERARRSAEIRKLDDHKREKD